MFKAMILILLTLIILKKGITGCLAFIIASGLILITGYTLLRETGIVLGMLVSLGVGMNQIRK